MPVRLMFLLDGDSTPVVKEMNKLPDVGKKTGDEFGEKFAKSALSQIRAYIGAAAMARLIASTVKGAVTEGGRITAGAKKLDVTPQTFQVLERLSERTGESLEDIRDTFEEATMDPRSLAKWEEVVANMLTEGKIMSDEQVRNLEAWEIGFKDATRTVRRGIGETVAPPSEVWRRMNDPNFVPKTSPGTGVVEQLGAWKKEVLEELTQIKNNTGNTSKAVGDL
jgi:hypothetical protein